jgi:hypothetical protein
VASSNPQLASNDSVGLDEEYPYRPQPPGIDTGGDEAVSSFFSQPLQIFDTRRVFAAVCLVVLFAGNNLVVCPFMDVFNGPPAWYFLPGFCLFAAILAQGGLLSAGLVFFDGPFWLRAAICWGIGLLLWSCWAMGLFFTSAYGSWGSPTEVLQLGTFSLPLAALAIQLPLWFARTYLRWRIRLPNAQALVTRPFAIRDYFVGTAIVAVSITFARLARPATWPLDNYWGGWAMISVFLAVGSLLGVLPSMLFIFRFHNAWLGFALLLLYGFAVASLVAYIPNVIEPAFSAWDTAAIMILITSVGAFLGLGFAVARGCGYRLESGRVPRFQT